MNATFLLLFGAVAGLLVLLAWALRNPKGGVPLSKNLASLEDAGRPHATYFPVIRQAMSQQDFVFLEAHAPVRLVRRAHKDRQRITMLYLVELRADFLRLLRLVRVIAVLSPEVAAAHEFERLLLSVRFGLQYRMVLLGLYAGLLLMPQLRGLSEMVSDLALRMESAMKELGERAALAAALASTLNRRGRDMV